MKQDLGFRRARQVEPIFQALTVEVIVEHLPLRQTRKPRTRSSAWELLKGGKIPIIRQKKAQVLPCRTPCDTLLPFISSLSRT